MPEKPLPNYTKFAFCIIMYIESERKENVNWYTAARYAACLGDLKSGMHPLPLKDSFQNHFFEY